MRFLFFIVLLLMSTYSNAQLSVNLSSTNISCNGNSDGSVTATATGGTSGYTYNWNSGQTIATITGLAANTYVVTVTDGVGAIVVDSIIVNEPALLIANPQIISNYNGAAISCSGESDGSVEVVSSGGNGGFTYLWSLGGQNTTVINNLPMGTYCVTITDVNGCQVDTCIVINDPTPLAGTVTKVDIICHGDGNGQILVNATSGTGTLGMGGYEYKLLGPGQAGNVYGSTGGYSNLSTGAYTAFIRDGNNCEVQYPVSILEPDSISIDSIVVVDDICRGEATVYASGGGVGQYTYLWSNSRTTQRVTGLGIGTHFVTVTDANGCSTSGNINITQTTNPLTGYLSFADALCYGSSSGEIGVIVQGGTGVNTYLWNTVPVQHTIIADSLAAGSYTVTVTDADGCELHLTGAVEEPDELVVSASVLQDVTCAGGNNGVGEVDSTIGGTGPYTYIWADPSSQLGSSATNLSAGMISVVATDANACTATDTVTILDGQPIVLVSAVNNISCEGKQDGSINITGSNSLISSFIWSNMTVGIPNAGLGAGAYTLTVVDVNGCQASFTYQIEAPSVTLTTTDETCFDMVDGTASISINSPIDSFTYAWSSSLNGLILGTNPTFTGLAGNVYDADGDGQKDTVFYYFVTASDTTGCVFMDTAYIVRADSFDVMIIDNNNGTAQANVTGGVAPYTYLWSNNQTTSFATGLAGNQYCSVIVTDVNGCYTVDSVSITIGINQIPNLEAFSIYPNPNQGVFQMELAFAKAVKGTVVFRDILGKIIFKKEIEGQEIQEQVNMQQLDAGMYFLSLNVNGRMVTRKITVLE